MLHYLTRIPDCYRAGFMSHSIKLPEQLTTTIAAAHLEIASHPKHHLSPKTRRALYDLIHMLTPPTAQQILGQTAVITAQRVLPIFERALPDERIPRRLLVLAQRILAGRLSANSWRVERYADLSYHASGNFWGHDEEDVPFSADLAGYAARKALLEVCGYKPLRNVQHLYVFIDQQRLSGDQLTDAHLAHNEKGDTAGAAAIAYAIEQDDPIEAPKRLEMFWVWWLDEALAQGWMLVHS